MALKKEDVLLHSEDHIIHSLELQHAKFISKHISKVTGKMVYVYGKAKDAAGNLLDKDATENITKVNTAKDDSYESAVKTQDKSLNQVEKASRKSDENYDRSKSKLKSLGAGESGNAQAVSASYSTRKKGTLHKAYDGTLSSIAKLFK